MWRWYLGGLALAVGGVFLSGKVTAQPEFWSPPLAIVFLLVGLAILARVDAFLHRWFVQPLDCEVPCRLFQQIANDPEFQELAGLLRRADAGRLASFKAVLTDAHICYSVPWQGGHAGHGPSGGVVLGLSHLSLRVAPAAHELFHLARHVHGLAPFHEDWLSRTIREEFIVWTLTVRYAPLSGSLELLPKLVLVGIGVAVVLNLYYRFC
jgi:hypothetical protein